MNIDMKEGNKFTFLNLTENKKTLSCLTPFLRITYHLNFEDGFLSDGCILGHNSCTVVSVLCVYN